MPLHLTAIAANRRPPRRRGTLYLSVLGTAMMVSIVGLTAMHLARTELRAVTGDGNMAHARLAAEAAIAHGLASIEQNADWRTLFEARAPQPPDAWVSIGGGEFQFVLDAGAEPDGDPLPLDQAELSPITLRGIGRAGDSLSVVEVTLENDGAGLPILDTALSAAGNIDLVLPPTGLLQVRVDRVIYAGADITCVEGNPTIVGDTEAVGNITSNISTGTETEGVPLRVVPSVSDALEYYKQRGTRIDIDQITDNKIQGALITPSHNPYGTETNPEGIYVIDCQDQTLSIENSRIVGTLVVLNNDDESAVETAVNWAPAVENYPVLMTENGFALNYDSKSRLRESAAGNNLNPPGFPLEGDENTTLVDKFANEVNGLVYIGGALTLSGTGCARVNGVVVCGSAVLGGDLEINHRSLYFDSPPPGFADQGAVKVMIGSWRRGQN